MAFAPINACMSCIHRVNYDGGTGKIFCDAFEGEPPRFIRNGSNPHTTPVHGDHGKVWALRPGGGAKRQMETYQRARELLK